VPQLTVALCLECTGDGITWLTAFTSQSSGRVVSVGVGVGLWGWVWVRAYSSPRPRTPMRLALLG
jgi:hypothetical protein